VIYSVVPADMMLTQGDLIDAVPIYRQDESGQIVGELIRAVVLTQACDLAQGKAKRVVLANVYPAEQLVTTGEVKAAAVRDQIRFGKMFGLYFLPAAQEPIPVPESIIDLRDLHTVPRAVLEKLAADGHRPARLNTPYREHLAQHFAVSYMRIALPDQYDTRG
jgi:hypothetical protein